jgi:hypothetical protein
MMASRRLGRNAGLEPGRVFPPSPAQIGAVKVIGLGGIGAPLAQSLVHFLAYRPLCPTVSSRRARTRQSSRRASLPAPRGGA